MFNKNNMVEKLNRKLECKKKFYSIFEKEQNRNVRGKNSNN